MSQITIRNLPHRLESLIRERSRREGTSLNVTITRMLSEAAGFEPNSRRYRDLSSLAGTWSVEETAEFEESQGIFDRIDEDEWK